MTQLTITPLSIHGKDYILVSDRIKLVLADEGYSMLSQERYELAGRYFFSVCIEIKGRRFYGDAEIKFGARANTPDGSSPVECAQTSALGRALGMAGYGVIESVASADEVLSAEAQQNVSQAPTMHEKNGASHHQANAAKGVSRQSGDVPEASGKATLQQMQALNSLSQRLGIPVTGIQEMSREEAAAMIGQLSQEQKSRRAKEDTHAS